MALAAAPDRHLQLRTTVREGMELHAHAAWPHEACGIVIWHGVVATGYIPAHNGSGAPLTRFVVDLGNGVWDALMDAEAETGVLLGLYHSHARGRAAPSTDDLVPGNLDVGWHGRPYALYAVRTDEWWLGRVG